MSTTIRQIMALFDEYRRTSASSGHKEPRFCEALGLPPIGYRIVEAAEQPGHRTKKTLGCG